MRRERFPQCSPRAPRRAQRRRSARSARERRSGGRKSPYIDPGRRHSPWARPRSVARLALSRSGGNPCLQSCAISSPPVRSVALPQSTARRGIRREHSYGWPRQRRPAGSVAVAVGRCGIGDKRLRHRQDARRPPGRGTGRPCNPANVQRRRACAQPLALACQRPDVQRLAPWAWSRHRGSLRSQSRIVRRRRHPDCRRPPFAREPRLLGMLKSAAKPLAPASSRHWAYSSTNRSISRVSGQAAVDSGGGRSMVTAAIRRCLRRLPGLLTMKDRSQEGSHDQFESRSRSAHGRQVAIRRRAMGAHGQCISL